MEKLINGITLKEYDGIIILSVALDELYFNKISTRDSDTKTFSTLEHYRIMIE